MECTTFGFTIDDPPIVNPNVRTKDESNFVNVNVHNREWKNTVQTKI